jgi:hypothetical protein
MSFTNRINVIVDIATQNASKSLKSLRADIANADTATGKFRVAAGGAADFLKQNMATAALAAGAALVTFATKAVGAFQSTALEAGKFSDATGLAVEDASRWIEVAGDIGIEAATVEKAIGKMNKELGSSPEKFEALGVSVVKAADGTVDLNATFLNAIETINGIQDPTKRAALAAQVFGRGWQSMAELIGKGSDKLRKDLAAVSGSKVIDEAELARARKFRDDMDELGDKLQDVALAVGENLVPVLSDVVDVITDIGDAVGWVGKQAGKLDVMNPVLEEVTENMDGATVVMGEFVRVTREEADEAERLEAIAQDTRDEINALAKAHGQATRAANDQKATWEGLTESLDNEEAILNLTDQFIELNTKFGEAWEAGSTGSADAAAKNREYQQTVIDTKRDILELTEGINGIPKESATKLIALIDDGSFDEAERRLMILMRNREFTISANAKGLGGVGYDTPKPGAKRAAGGPVAAGQTYLVGEQGPEVLTMGNTSGHITPNHQLGRGAAGAPMVINITTGADPQAVIAAIKQYQRRGGVL